MKVQFLFLALALSSLLFSCQKDPSTSMPSQTTTEALVIEQWLLLEYDWQVSLTPSTLVATSAGIEISGTKTTVALLPAQVKTRLTTDGVSLASITAVWETTTAGYVLKVQSGGTTYVYWFTSATSLRSIGRVIA